MRAFLLDRYGKQRALKLSDVPMPTLRDDEVLVEVHAAGVNLLDVKIRNGEFKPILPYRLPLVLGHDVAGVVVRTGALARGVEVGDEVYARVDDGRIGTFAEFVPVKASSLAPKPRDLSMVEAASIPLVGLTAWQALVEMARVRPGQQVFIQAGSGGVGTFAIQLAKHWAPALPPPPARPTPRSSRAWAPMWWWTTAARTLKRPCTSKTWC